MAGLPLPSDDLPTPSAVAPPPVRTGNIGGFLPVGNIGAALAMDSQFTPPAPTQENSAVVQGLAGHIDAAWADAKAAKQDVEDEMIEALLARRGEYTAEKRAQIAKSRQPEIYMMVGASKMRQIEALLRDVLIGTGSDKPWTTEPTPVPELPPEVAQTIVAQLTAEIQQAAASGFPPSVEAARGRVRQLVEEVTPLLMEEARRKAARMEARMEDQQVEGGFMHALDQFITDLATFKTAFIAGPIVRRRPKLSWGPDGQMVVETALVQVWERRSPFDVFPARYAKNLQDDPLIVKHRLSRRALTEMKGVEGYSSEAIDTVLDLFGDSGLREWLSVEAQQDAAEGRTTTGGTEEGMIDALQFWGSASGKMLLEWGMTKAQVPDPSKEYQIEAWKIGPHVIRAVLNADPLARRNIFGTSYHVTPGSVWGNSPFDLIKDCQDMCNAAARSLAANMGISSGPQVGIISNRLPANEDVTEMYPWKIWQFESDPMGSTAAPITFFQPTSNANELMTVYERFSVLADEYTGIPRYMAGFNEGAGGAGRTASGISMMIGNAGKIIKQVLGNIDINIVTPLIEYQYYYNMRYSDDPELKGDVRIKARGALSMASKEQAQVRMNEFLQVALTNPMVQQLVGMEGLAELLRPTVRRLDVNPDKVVPPLAVMKQRAAQQAMLAQLQMAAQGQRGPGGRQALPAPQGQPKAQSKERLQNGAPVTDNFSPVGA